MKKIEYHLGVTATQEGLTNRQKQKAKQILRKFKRRNCKDQWFHHGDCIGGDAELHDIAVKLGYNIEIHPSNLLHKRAFKKGDIVHDPKPPLIRNRIIVKIVGYLLAFPKESKEIWRSGTWTTIRYARSYPRRHRIIKP